jgi:hypothetical protein
MYQLINTEKLACLRRRLAVGADAAMRAALTHLLEKETESRHVGRHANRSAPAGVKRK